MSPWINNLIIAMAFMICMPTAYANNESDGPTELMIAIESGCTLDEVLWHLAEGQNADEIYSNFLRAYKPVLRYALDRGTDQETVRIIETLINAGADVNAITYNRVTDRQVYGMMPLLSYAVIYSSPEIVALLIENGADVNCKLCTSSIDSCKTPLQYALELNKHEIVELLESAGAL